VCVCVCEWLCVCVCGGGFVMFGCFGNICSCAIYRTTQFTNLEECGPCTVSGICLTAEGKAWKNLSQGSRRMSVGKMKTEYTEQSISFNKNT
jgi:hypothetical protein